MFIMSFCSPFKGSVMACGQVDSTSIINCISYTPFPYGFHGFLLGVGNNKSHSIVQQETVLLPQTCSV